MKKLSGKAVNSTLVEWIGPVNGRNYMGSGVSPFPSPVVEIRVFGTGGVKLQSNNTAIYKTPGSPPNAFRYDRVPNEANWTDVGAEITQASGYVQRTVTVEDYTNFLRVIVSTAGDAKVEIKSIWN